MQRCHPETWLNSAYYTGAASTDEQLKGGSVWLSVPSSLGGQLFFLILRELRVLAFGVCQAPSLLCRAGLQWGRGRSSGDQELALTSQQPLAGVSWEQGLWLGLCCPQRSSARWCHAHMSTYRHTFMPRLLACFRIPHFTVVSVYKCKCYLAFYSALEWLPLKNIQM